MEHKQPHTNSTNPKPRPFLKWAGGKGQLLETFRRYYSKELKSGAIKHYYEPFLGGGAVFFDIISRYEIEKAYLYDINEELILVYKVVQQEVEELINQLVAYETSYKVLAPAQRSEMYYDVRNQYNEERAKITFDTFNNNWVGRAAKMIFLNKTCYNGLFRLNQRGEFNTPAGDYKNPTICDANNLHLVSQALQKADICRGGFQQALHDLQNPAFVYFDPPYRPISKTASFTAYSRHAFTDNEQRQLAETFQSLADKGAQVMLSNSDPKNEDKNDHFFDDLYENWYIHRVQARRAINSNAKKRGTIKELIITSYPTRKNYGKSGK